jgi:hypothetical protein
VAHATSEKNGSHHIHLPHTYWLPWSHLNTKSTNKTKVFWAKLIISMQVAGAESHMQSLVSQYSNSSEKESDYITGAEMQAWPTSVPCHTTYVALILSSEFLVSASGTRWRGELVYFTVCIFACDQNSFCAVYVVGSKLESCFLPYWEANEAQCTEQLDDPRNWNLVSRM